MTLAKLLWWGKTRRVTGRTYRGFLRFPAGFSNSKIYQEHLTSWGDFNVGWFDIPMDDWWSGGL